MVDPRGVGLAVRVVTDMGTAARRPDPGPPADVVGTSSVSTGREARHPLAGGRRVADVVASAVLLVALAVEAVVAGWAIVFLSLVFGSCDAPGNSCNAALGGAVVYVGPVLVGLVALVAIVWAVSRLVRRRVAWPVPVVGITAIVVVFFACRLLVDAAVTRGI
ncbi:hypothetical protein NS184_12410 [Curtobacterium luteum]|uniref:Uncharacterized protein n=1 Tax=Curtobacterium luteum TaxID=33881 RepID=A0A175RKR8_9MICO|nr:hypothetical protein NS184_12410 [Curtobacterium luteum]